MDEPLFYAARCKVDIIIYRDETEVLEPRVGVVGVSGAVFTLVEEIVFV